MHAALTWYSTWKPLLSSLFKFSSACGRSVTAIGRWISAGERNTKSSAQPLSSNEIGRKCFSTFHFTTFLLNSNCYIHPVLQHSADFLLLSLATHAPQRIPSSATYNSQASTGHCSDVPSYQVTFLGLCFVSFEACLLFIVQTHEHRYSTPLSSRDGRAE